MTQAAAPRAKRRRAVAGWTKLASARPLFYSWQIESLHARLVPDRAQAVYVRDTDSGLSVSLVNVANGRHPQALAGWFTSTVSLGDLREALEAAAHEVLK